jgi:hypothetical protein
MGLSPTKLFSGKSNAFPAVLILLTVLISLVFRNSFVPGLIVFSNDGPLGANAAACRHLPDKFAGSWQDLSLIGSDEGGAWPCVTYLSQWLLGPVVFAKFYPVIALLLLGIGAWCFFRQLGLAPLACILGGVAAMFNSSYFSVACWGVAGHTITVAMSFFAIAALTDTESKWRWLKLPLAGLAVGLGVEDGADVGAIFSVFVAAYGLCQALAGEGAVIKKLSSGVIRVAVVAIVAGLVAAQAVLALVGTNITGVAGTKQDTRSKEERWEFCTTWSLPKRELLCLVIPGLFGYRMDSSQHGLEGGDYWGAVGRPESVDRLIDGGGNPGKETLRFTGGGNYAGVLVVLLAIWTAVRALRNKDSTFSSKQKRLLWFWMALVVGGLLLAVGRYASFYRLVYALPYFSTIRNPAKFIYIVNWGLVVLFAHGVHGLWRSYVESPAAAGPARAQGAAKNWWAALNPFDRKWTIGCGVALAASIVGWISYTSSRPTLEKFLQKFGPPDIPGTNTSVAPDVASFSFHEVAWFILFLALSIGLVTLILSGRFRGARARWAGVALGVLLFVDMARANQPWIIYWDWKEKYASDPVLDFLRNKPFEQRVTLFPLDGFLDIRRLPVELAQSYLDLRNLYHIEWKQHQFQYFDIQCLDVIQMPRIPEDLNHYLQGVQRYAIRYWELTSTRYFLAQPALVQLFNQKLDVAKGRFRVLRPFELAAKPGMSGIEDKLAVSSTNGQFAVVEFSGALPKAMLNANWQICAEDSAAVAGLKTNALDPGDLELLQSVGTNDFLTLKTLVSPAFEPASSVLLSEPINLPRSLTGTNSAGGTVEFATYSPKRIQLHAKAAAPSVLLLNDKYDPSWKVFVDGKPDKVLRCNFIMRGVALPAGDHQVEFRFEPRISGLYISVVATVLCLGILGFVVFANERPDTAPESTTAEKMPAGKASGKAAGKKPVSGRVAA